MKCLIALLVACCFPIRASCASPSEDLTAVIAQINAKPADKSLRERAIALARAIKPSPAVPSKAKRAFVMGDTYHKEAVKPSDFALAVDSFNEALLAAPWWGQAYEKLSVSLESAGRFGEAADALELYLLTKPKDREKAQSRLYALEAKSNMAKKRAEESARAAAPAPAKAAAESVTLVCQPASGESFMLRIDYARGMVDMPHSGDLPNAIGTAFASAAATVAESSVHWDASIRDQAVFKGSVNRLSGIADVFFSVVHPGGRIDNVMFTGPCSRATKQY